MSNSALLREDEDLPAKCIALAPGTGWGDVRRVIRHHPEPLLRGGGYSHSPSELHKVRRQRAVRPTWKETCRASRSALVEQVWGRQSAQY